MLPHPILILALPSLIILLSATAHAELLLDKYELQAGEALRITLVPAVPEHTMLIIAPTTTYRFIGGLGEDMTFVPSEAGEHVLQVLDGSDLVASASFTVSADQPVPTAQRSFIGSTEVATGSPILIDAPVLEVLDIRVAYGNTTWVTVDSVRPVVYVAEQPGVYTVTVNFVNGTAWRANVTAVGDAQPYAAQPVPAQLAPHDQQLVLFDALNRTTRIEHGSIVRQVTSPQHDPWTMLPTYTLDALLPGETVKQLVIDGIPQNVTNPTIGLEELVPAQLIGAPPQTVEAFAIDPTTLRFTAARLSFVAKGYALYKCVLYDFSARRCNGENAKLMDLQPGLMYTIELSPLDPLFSQTGYLTNPFFDVNTNGWTTLTDTGTPVYSWVSSDPPQSGTGQINLSGSNKVAVANYYQQFNLTIPPGTALIGINFSVRWRVPSYSAGAGSMGFWIQNAARTATYCQVNRTFTSTTAWAKENMTTGAAGCLLSSFAVNTNYTFRLRCGLNTTSGATQQESCRFDDANVTVWYNDTAAPVLRSITDTPDPVNWGERVNFTVNVTDNIQVNATIIEVNGTNYTLSKGQGDIYYYDQWSTARTPGTYFYMVFANDSNGNKASNTSASLNFTVRDALAPNVSILSPQDGLITSNATLAALFNVTDQVGADNCTLIVDGVARNSTRNPPLGASVALSTVVAEGSHYYNVSCNDTSGNRNTSATRLFVRDTTSPLVFLSTGNGSVAGNSTVVLQYNPQDPTLDNCSLWLNATVWQRNQTNTTPSNYSGNSFTVTMQDGAYLWNVECADKAGNRAFNSTNRTVIVDTSAPYWSGVLNFPTSGVTYAPGASYQFNSTWNDALSGVDAVLLETNVSGALQNSTTSRDGAVFYRGFSDLAAGAYAYRWHANDSAVSQNNRNQTPAYTYTVVRALAILTLAFNGTESDVTIDLNATLNISGDVVTPTFGYLELYLDGSLIASGQGPLSNVSMFTEQKRHNVTLTYVETQNYSRTSLTRFVDVLDTIAPSVSLDSPPDGAFTTGTVEFRFTPHDNVDIGNCTIILDGVWNTSNASSNNQQNTITIYGISEAGHTWQVNCSDTSNNSVLNGTWSFTTDTTPPSAFSLLSPPSGTVAANMTPALQWQQTTESNFANYTAQIDNDIGFGSVNYGASVSDITNTTWEPTIADQTTWYWRVTAYDKATNSRTSAVFNYTVDTLPPAVGSTAPGDGSWRNTTAVTLTYTPMDFSAMGMCALYVDGHLNQTNTTITSGVPNNFTLVAADGHYNWSVRCTDAAGSSNEQVNSSLGIDTVAPPAFGLYGPLDGAVTGATPSYSWQQVAEENFADYTIEVSDDALFSYANHTYVIALITNTTITQSVPLTDGTWHWRVLTHDLAGNTRVVHPTFDVDTTPPDPFDLVAPPNGTEQRNDTPLFVWEASGDAHFSNYTLLVSANQDFSTISYSAGTLDVNDNNLSMTVGNDVVWWWMVIAYDQVNLSRNSTRTFQYLSDMLPPNVSLISPPNNPPNITASNLVSFKYNVTDVGSVANCSLFIDDLYDSILYDPAKGVNITVSANVENGNHNWSVWCTDIAGNIGNSTVRYFNVSVRTPTLVLYESSPGTVNYTASQRINLTYTPDAVENRVSYSVPSATLTTAVNATITLNGSGMLLANNTLVNFSGVFSQSNTNAFYVTWKLIRVNASGSTLLCQYGNDNTGGAPIGSTAKKTLRSSCTYTGGTIQMLPGENITLTVNLYNGAGVTRTFTHFWEGASNSSVSFRAWRLGTLKATLANMTDPNVSEDASFVERCNLSCTDGVCLNTEVWVQLYNGSEWLLVSSVGNVTLNSSQANPVPFGNLEGLNVSNFSLYGSMHSYNNSLRCFANSTYSSNLSVPKNISVIDRLAPTVLLLSPGNSSIFPAQNITFSYEPYDRRLANCTLWGNWTGWAPNQTHLAPDNQSTNSFAPIFLDYGSYVWNVRCTDTVGNSAYNATNYSILIAGDVSISSDGISFSTESPVENLTVLLYANVTNNANKTESAVLVQFWDGDPLGGGTQIGNRTISLAPLSANLTNMTWTALLGTHAIYVVLDWPIGAGSITESDETNNVANRTITTPAWQRFYGNVTGQFLLSPSTNESFVNWSLSDIAGNIYIADSDTKNGIQWSHLAALGRNTTNGSDASTSDDFEQADALLAMQSYTDNMNSTFTENGGLRQSQTFTVWGKGISDVATTNSSGGNFTTGVLWDTDDSTNPYYDDTDAEDIVFVSAINVSQTGSAGAYDYEIIVPARLRDYYGTQDKVSLYYEIW